MAKVFITGSADGIGHLAAKMLADAGHTVVVHGRNEQRAADALAAVPGAFASVYGDLSSIGETIQLAGKVNELGTFDAVIHNAGIGDKERHRVETADGLPHVFAVNALAPYILTCLIHKPKRLIYTSSGMHRGADISLDDLAWKERNWNGTQAYCDSKFYDVLLAFAVARHWPDVLSNAVDPGWVPTKMGGPSAPDKLEEGPQTQVWLATSDEAGAHVSGKYFHHMRERGHLAETEDIELQDRFLRECEKISGIRFPG
ncbi:MAG: SDR family NAD(P)-dependent oxidoreductase [Bacteroidetes bacterium]|nr:SDR family NAD(P)-dependent oxidoreductase [Bacteroidota bacterium]